MHPCPKASVIVPVYNCEKNISLCLNSLLELDYPKEFVEIIVVDNNSTDHTKDIIKRYPVKYVFEKKRSVACARNKGLENAIGEFIAFVDADCIADKAWLNNLIEVLLSDKSMGGVGGKILSLNPYNWIEKYIDLNNFYCQYGQVNEMKYFLPWLATANAAFRKEVLTQIGLFDTALSPSEDVDITARIILAGWHIRYAPDAIVFHKHRSKLVSFSKWRFWRGRAAPYLLFKYKKITKVNFKKQLLREAWETISSIRVNLGKFICNVSKNAGQTKPLLLLDVLSCVVSFVGYSCGWLEMVFGIKKIPTLDVNNRRGVLWWGEGRFLGVADFSKRPPRYLYLGDSGKRIWELLVMRDKNPDEIADILIKEYNTTYEVIRLDLDNFFSGLKEVGIWRSSE